MRAEFRVWHDDKGSHYVMFDQATRERVYLTNFPIGSVRINELMQPLMAAISAQEILRHRLFQIEFLTSQTGEALVTLVYHKQLSMSGQKLPNPLREKFGIDIIGRARKQKIVLDAGLDHRGAERRWQDMALSAG